MSRRLPLVLVVAACFAPLIWPGDTSFINDEPLLIASALASNAAHRLAPMGLAGTFDFTYGPLPTWLYQALVLVTHDLVTMVVLHVLLLMLTTGLALWWLARSLRLWPWFAVIPLLSPYTWFYARVLWDNTLLLPLTALALAGYAAYLSSGSAIGLRVSVAATLSMPLVHLMSLALVIPLGLHMLLVRWRDLRVQRVGIAIITITMLVLAGPYWLYLVTSHSPRGGVQSLDGWLFPLLGGRLFSARHLEYFFGSAPSSGAVLGLAASVSWLAYLFVWAGIAIALWRVVRAVYTGQWTAHAHVAVILLGALICQTGIDGFSGKYQHPHYENGSWAVFAVLAWLAADAAASLRSPLRWLAPGATGLLAASLIVAVATVTTRLHRSGGTRETYGATVANQQRVARELTRYPADTAISCSVVLIQRYPHALATLRQLNPGTGDRRVREVEIRYAYPNPSSGVISVLERP